MRAPVSSLKRNRDGQNKVMLLNKFYFQLIFLSPYAENQRVNQLSQLIPRLVGQLVGALRGRRGVGDQSLKQSF